MTFEEWYPYKSELVNGIGNNPIARYRYEAAQAAWHAAQEAMKDRACSVCMGNTDPHDKSPWKTILPMTTLDEYETPDCWDWHCKDYVSAIRALEVI